MPTLSQHFVSHSAGEIDLLLKVLPVPSGLPPPFSWPRLIQALFISCNPYRLLWAQPCATDPS